MKRKGTILIITGLLLITAALCLVFSNLHEEISAGETADIAVEKLHEDTELIAKEKEKSETITVPEMYLDPDREMPETEINGVKYIGTLEIEALGLSLPVASQWSYVNLRSSPCRYTGSAYNNTLTICAHNYNTHFGRLKELSPGDVIYFVDVEGTLFAYTVEEILILQPTDVEEMIDSEWDLSLFTCTIGGRTRVTVRCMRAN